MCSSSMSNPASSAEPRGAHEVLRAPLSMSARFICPRRLADARRDTAAARAPASASCPRGSGWSGCSQPSCVEPLRPECPSCRQIFAGELSCTKSTMRCQASRCAVVPQPRAAGRDAALRRNAGHLREHAAPHRRWRARRSAPDASRPARRPRRCTGPSVTPPRDSPAHAAQRERQKHRRPRRRHAAARCASSASTSATKPRIAQRRLSWPMRWLPVSRLYANCQGSRCV